MNATVTRRLVKAARRTKVLVEALIVNTVKLHAKVLDRQVTKAYAVGEATDKQADILAAATADMREHADDLFDQADALKKAVAAEKRSLGL